MSPSEPGLSLAEGWQLSRLTAFEMWLAYFTLGGDASGLEVQAYIHGALRPHCYQHNLIARILNDHFVGAGLCQRVAYQDPGHQ